MAVVTYLVCGVLYFFIQYMIFGCMLELRWKKLPLWFQSILITIVLQIPTIIRGFMEGAMYDAMAYVQLIMMILALVIIFKDKLWVKVLAMAIYYFLAVISELVTFAFLGDWVVGVDFYGNSIEALIIQLIIMVILFGSFALVAVIWNLLLKKRYIPKNIWLFLLFPIGQIFMMDTWSAQVHAGEIQFQSQISVLIGMLVGFIADSILFYVIFMQGEKEEMKRRLAETEHLMELERTYYESVKERQEEVAKIRHDFNNQLTAALQMVENGEMNKSQELLEQMRVRILQSSEKKWCQNAVVNAVLTDKSQSCAEKQITFDAEVSITDDVKIDQIHLCSLFSNLLDNAIHAAVESKEEGAYVKLRASVKEKYFFIKVENASLKLTTKTTVKGHGYGLQIVRSIAEQYNGEYHADWNDGVYSALVTLELMENMK